MIKNAKELKRTEKELFRKTYIEYFKKVCVYNYGHLPSHSPLNKALLQLNARRYANEMLRRIENGTSISYVNIFAGEIDAFITGYVEGTTAKINNVFHVDYDPIKVSVYRNRILLEVYRDIAMHFRTLGATTVQAEALYEDPFLVDVLYSLDFEEVGFSETEINYSKALFELDEEKSHGSI